MCLTELLDMIHQPNKIGTETPTLNEIDNSYGVNRVPIQQHLSALIGESSNTASTKQKRKAPAAAMGPEKKRQYDRAYRLRCKEKKEKNEQDIVVLTEENDKLKRENEQFKMEGVKQSEMVRTQNEQMKVVNSQLRHLKPKLQAQNAFVVAEMLLKQSTGSNNIDLQRENAQLKHYFNQLKREISNPENINVIQLEAEIKHLENKKHSLQVIIDALCEKINDDQTGPAWTSRTSMTRRTCTDIEKLQHPKV